MTPLDPTTHARADAVRGTPAAGDDRRRDGASFERALERRGRPGQGERQGEARDDAGARDAHAKTRRRRPDTLHGPRRRGTDDLEAGLRAAGLTSPGAPSPHALLGLDAATGGGTKVDGTAAASGAAATASLVGRLVDEVARAAEVTRVAGQPRLDVELDLGRLGGGRVSVARSPRGLQVRLELDGARARELASAGLDDLRRGLDGRGLDVAALELAGTEADAARRAAFGPGAPTEAENRQGPPDDPRRQPGQQQGRDHDARGEPADDEEDGR